MSPPPTHPLPSQLPWELDPVAEPQFEPPQGSVVELRDAATLLGTIGRPDEMLSCCLSICKSVAQSGEELSLGDVELLAAALKRSLRPQQEMLRAARACERQVSDAGTVPSGVSPLLASEAAKENRRFAEREVAGVCRRALSVLRTVGSAPRVSVGAEVLLKLLEGDYNRYLCGVAPRAAEGAAAPLEAAEAAYDRAAEMAEGSLPEAHPLVLGLALNRSVFAHEVLKIPDRGGSVARDAFDQQQKLTALQPAEQRRSADVLRLLKENVTLWTDGLERDDADEEGAEEGNEYATFSRLHEFGGGADSGLATAAT
eukprot:Hpha_TRINITY_DN15997_c10_g11::TRINITY_DN15997_c10_g11_i1::g.70348::m.70348